MSADHADQLSGALTQRDRRRRYRARVHWPVQFEGRDDCDLLPTETQDISSDGFYCRSKVVFSPGNLSIVLSMYRRIVPKRREGCSLSNAEFASCGSTSPTAKASVA